MLKDTVTAPAPTWRAMIIATATATADPEIGEDSADVAVVTAADACEIRTAIREQLAAFRAGNGAKAWHLSSLGIRETFPTPDDLMVMIRRCYAPLLSTERVAFGEFSLTPEGIGIRLEVGNRQRRHFTYLVVRAGTGWLINGCVGTFDYAVGEA